MVSKRMRLLAVGVTTYVVANAGLAAAQTQSWVGELPTVEQVRRSTPAGKGERDTILRQSAAFVFWQDVIEAFTKKSGSGRCHQRR
jgi:hypothetical protein